MHICSEGRPPERGWFWGPEYGTQHVRHGVAAADLPSCYRLVAGAPVFEAPRAGQR
ncbi:hypothetical protein GCM10027597_08060 [Saccharopolyspora tripterygii]